MIHFAVFFAALRPPRGEEDGLVYVCLRSVEGVKEVVTGGTGEFRRKKNGNRRRGAGGTGANDDCASRLGEEEDRALARTARTT